MHSLRIALIAPDVQAKLQTQVQKRVQKVRREKRVLESLDYKEMRSMNILWAFVASEDLNEFAVKWRLSVVDSV